MLFYAIIAERQRREFAQAAAKHWDLKTPKEEWELFKDSHPAIISQHDFDTVQQIRCQRVRPQKFDVVNPLAGMVFCADCGSRMTLNRNHRDDNKREHFKCGSYSQDTSACGTHFIRSKVLNDLVISEINNRSQQSRQQSGVNKEVFTSLG